MKSHHEPAIAFAEAKITAANEAAQRHPAAYHRRRYGDCCGVDSRDDCGDVVGRRGRVDRVTSCTSDSDSICRHPTTVAMT